MKFAKDPLIHFILFGAVLFVGHALWTTHVTRADRALIVDTREITRQSELFAVENGRAPDQAELQGIVLAFVEEEVLAREAVKLGLDENDTIIRRRLAQKMRLLGEASANPTPAPGELESWFETRRDDYAVPARRGVEHVFFSDENRQDAKADAAVADLTTWKSVGDPFILSRTIPPLARTKMTQDYGEAFARTAFEAELDRWSAPVRSPFGIHRIRVTEMLPRIEPNFAQARADALEDWQQIARDRGKAERLRELVAQYDVIIQEPDQ